MASQYQVEEEEEEPVAAERELADDAMWKVIQKNTFTRWANENLKPAKVSINDLEKDLSDGLKLISLLECLSGKKFQKFNRRPTFRTQKFENVTMSLKFLEKDEGIRLVNIDSSDLVDCKLKLIMGLIWTLILHYSISMPTWEDEDPAAKDQTPKQRLLAWIQSKIPEKNITNFTSDWNDGTAIAALVNALAPGSVPDWRKMKPKDAVNNAKLAEDAAEKNLDIPQLIKPNEMCNPAVDELSMMTYLSRFPQAAPGSKPGQVKPKTGAAPAAQDGPEKVNPARCKAYGPGLEPTGNVVGAPARFIVETAGAGKGQLEVVAMSPRGTVEKCEVFPNNDRTVSYNCVYTPTMEGQYKITIKFAGKEIPKCPYLVQVTGKLGDPSKVIAQGPGIESKGVTAKKKTYFEVITKGAGAGVVDVGIVDPAGKKDTIKTTITKKADDLWYVEYTPEFAGLHSVNVNFAGKPIPKSPYPVGVSAAGAQPLDGAKMPQKPASVTPREAAIDSLATPLKAAPGSGVKEPEEAPLGQAVAPGQQAAPGQPAPGGAKRAWATGRGVQPKGLRVGEEAVFKVHTENAGVDQPKVLITAPGGGMEKYTMKKVNTTFEYTYKPMRQGTYIITINFGGQAIPKSPFKVEVAPVKKSNVKAYGPGLETGVVGQPANFTVEPNGEAPIGFKIEGPSQAKIDVKKDPETGSMDVTYWPTAPGEYAVHVLVNNDDTPKSPYMADILPAAPGFDASKVTASGPGLEKTGVVVNKMTEFTVDARQAGQAPLAVTAYDVDGNKVPVNIQDNRNGTYKCTYTAMRVCKHTITITYGGVSIQKSPYKVMVSDGTGAAPGGPAGAAPGKPAGPAAGTPASKVKVYGDALDRPVVPNKATYFIVDCKEAGPGTPQVSLVDASGKPVPFKMVDKRDRTFRADFTATTVGVYTLNVSFAAQPVNGSPFKINVEAGPGVQAAPDASKVKVYGPALEKPIPANTSTHLIIDCTEAGAGEPRVNLMGPGAKQIPYKLINNGDKTFTVEFEATIVGVMTASVFFVGKPVPKSPFKITVEPSVAASKVKVYGPAVEQPVTANQPTFLIVDCKDAGDGQPMITLANDKGAMVPFKMTDNKDKTFKVEFQATVPGVLTANVFFQSRPVPQSPFKINVQPGAPVDLSKIQVRGLPEVVPVNKETPFEIVTAGAGPGQPKAVITSPSGRSLPVALQPQQPDVAVARFTPTEPGPHTVAVTFNDQPVPHSPFRVMAQAPNPMRVKVYGPALEKPVAPYQPTFLVVDCKEAGPGEPAVTLLDSNGAQVPFNILDNKDRTYRVEFSAVTTGTLVANVAFANQPVPNSPFRVTVQSGVKVYGPAVEGPVQPHQTTYMIIDCKDAGPGQPMVNLTTEHGAQVPARLTNNNDGTYKVEFEPNIPAGTLVANVGFNNQPVPNSPFKVTVSPSGAQPGTGGAPNVTVKGLPQTVPIGKPVPFGINTMAAGPGQPKVNVVSPSGHSAPAPIGQSPEGFVSQLLANEPGPHEVQVTFNDQPVPNSPFKVMAVPEGQQPAAPGPGDPNKVKAYGPGLTGGTAGTPCDFTIDTSESGPGALGLTIDGPTKAEIECFDQGAGIYNVRYYPTEPGEYVSNILYDEKPINGSPFRAQVNPAQMIDVSGVKTYGPGVSPNVLMESVADFTVDAKSVVPKGQGKVKAILTTPNGTLNEIQVIDNKDGTYTGLYTPFEQGPHQVDISYDGIKVPLSPFHVGAVPGCDPTKVKAYGPGLLGANPRKPAHFTISTRGAGQGGVGLSAIGPTEPKVSCVDNQDGTLTVEYLPDSVGDHEIGVTFADQPIPGSPFHVNVTEEPVVNPNAVKCYGPGLNPQGVRKGTLGVFTVDAMEAGEAHLEVVTTDVTSGQRIPADVAKVKPGMYDVTYQPDFEGPCRVDVNYGGHPVPNSPFTTNIQPSTDLAKVFVTGEGAQPNQNIPASIPVSFVVDARQQAGRAQLDVDITGPQGKPVKASIQPFGDGTYLVSYTPEDVGPHTVAVKYAGQDIPMGPIRVNAVPVGDANKVQIATENIKQTLAVGEESVIHVRKAEAGEGKITCSVTSQSHEEVELSVIENEDNTTTIRYTPTKPGVYTADVKYGGRPVPNGHITQTVGPVTHGAPQQGVVDEQSLHQATQMTAHTTQEETLMQQAVQKQHAAGPDFNSVFGPGQGAPSEVKPSDAPDVQPAPQEGMPSNYQPTDFAVKIGPDFSKADAVITTPSGVKHRPRIVQNPNGTIKVCYQPAEFGLHTLSVTYAGQPVPKSPFTFFVHEKKPGQVIAYGPGLSCGTAGQPTEFTVVTKDAGPGGLGLAIEGPSKAEIQCKDNKNGTATITYKPVVPGDYKIVLKFAGQLIQGAPFVAKVAPAEFTQETQQTQQQFQQVQQSQQQTHQTTQQTQQIERTSRMTVRQTSVMSLTSTETDMTNLTATIRSPSGLEEPCELKRQPNGQIGISFTPRSPGDHFVTVLRNGQPIPGSPFKVTVSAPEVGNASKVKITGQNITHAMANQVNTFNIDTREAGVGALSLSVVGPGKVEIKCDQNPDGTTKVSYVPTEPGQYQLAVKYADQHVPGSPFNVTVGGTGSGRVTESIVRKQTATQTTSSAGSLCELNIQMAGINVSELEGSVTAPSGQTEPCEVLDLGNNRFKIKFQPKENGIHTVSLKNKGIHIPGSPFQFTVGPIAGGGPHKVKAIGSGLERGEVNKPCPFTIITREAGPGNLSMGIEGPSKAKIDFQDRHDGTSDVAYTVTAPGEYLISVKYNGESIPDSPFKAFVSPSGGDSQKLNVHNLQQQGLQVDSPAQFTVDFNGAQGRLDAKVVAPSGTETQANVQEIQKDKYAVHFVPKESGVHMVHVRLNGNHIPGSPYPIQVGRLDADPSKVRAYGEGLIKGTTNHLCKFIVNTTEAGSGALNVGISGPSKVTLQCREVQEGYEFSYTPLAPGDYFITIKYAGQTQIPGSPFKVRIEGPGMAPASFAEESRVVMETVTKTTRTTQYSALQQQEQQLQQHHLQQVSQEPQALADATKVQASGAGLHQATVNQEAVFSVNGSTTGYNMLVVGISGPSIPCEQITVTHMGNLQYTVKYRLSKPGQYLLMVKWGDQHIPGSPYHITAQ